MVEFLKNLSYIGFPSDEYFTFLFSDDAAAAGAACCRYLLALEEPKMITNPMKAAVVIAYINIESAISCLLRACLKIFMAPDKTFYWNLYANFKKFENIL